MVPQQSSSRWQGDMLCWQQTVIELPASGARHSRPWQQSGRPVQAVVALPGRRQWSTTWHAPATQPSEPVCPAGSVPVAQHSASRKQVSSTPRHAHMLSVHVISPQQSAGDWQAPPLPVQHCSGRSETVESELTPQVKPAQHSAFVVHDWPCGIQLAIGSGRHMNVWHVRPSAHSLESRQNEPSRPAWHMPSRHIIRPQQSSEFVQG